MTENNQKKMQSEKRNKISTKNLQKKDSVIRIFE